MKNSMAMEGSRTTLHQQSFGSIVPFKTSSVM
jgi:hypothetical protein